MCQCLVRNSLSHRPVIEDKNMRGNRGMLTCASRETHSSIYCPIWGSRINLVTFPFVPSHLKCNPIFQQCFTGNLSTQHYREVLTLLIPVLRMNPGNQPESPNSH